MISRRVCTGRRRPTVVRFGVSNKDVFQSRKFCRGEYCSFGRSVMKEVSCEVGKNQTYARTEIGLVLSRWLSMPIGRPCKVLYSPRVLISSHSFRSAFNSTLIKPTGCVKGIPGKMSALMSFPTPWRKAIAQNLSVLPFGVVNFFKFFLNFFLECAVQTDREFFLAATTYLCPSSLARRPIGSCCLLDSVILMFRPHVLEVGCEGQSKPTLPIYIAAVY